jgi:hypothetical protein
MPKRAQIRALPTLGHGERLRIWQLAVFLLINAMRFSCQDCRT